MHQYILCFAFSLKIIIIVEKVGPIQSECVSNRRSLFFIYPLGCRSFGVCSSMIGQESRLGDYSHSDWLVRNKKRRILKRHISERRRKSPTAPPRSAVAFFTATGRFRVVSFCFYWIHCNLFGDRQRSNNLSQSTVRKDI